MKRLNEFRKNLREKFGRQPHKLTEKEMTSREDVDNFREYKRLTAQQNARQKSRRQEKKNVDGDELIL